MTGLKVALTGAVIFVVLAMFRTASISNGDYTMSRQFGILSFVALMTVPVGLIYQIWSH